MRFELEKTVGRQTKKAERDSIRFELENRVAAGRKSWTRIDDYGSLETVWDRYSFSCVFGSIGHLPTGLWTVPVKKRVTV